VHVTEKAEPNCKAGHISLDIGDIVNKSFYLHSSVAIEELTLESKTASPRTKRGVRFLTYFL
jgi:hypothetical protein